MILAIETAKNSFSVGWLGSFEEDLQSLMFTGWRWIEDKGELARSTNDLLSDVSGIFVLDGPSGAAIASRVKIIGSALEHASRNIMVIDGEHPREQGEVLG